MLLKSLVRGGQIFLHNFRMFKQVTAKLFLISWGVSSIIFFLILAWGVIPSYQRYEAYVFLNATAQQTISGNKAPLTVHDANGQWYTVTVGDVLSDERTKLLATEVLERLKLLAILSTALGLLFSSVVITGLLNRYGLHQVNKKRLRGSELMERKVLAKHLIKTQKASDLKLGDMPLLKNAEWGHVLCHGTTGAGKSTYLFHLLDQVRARGDRNIIYCKSGDFVRRYYRPGKDILLNALDVRSQSWDLWMECQAAYDFDELAKAMIPMPPGVDPFWVNGARMILAAAAWKMKDAPDRSLQGLIKQLLISDLSEAATLLKDTEAASLVSDKIEKTAVSIKAVLATYLKCLRYVREGREKFSIRQFIQKEHSDTWLFITSGGRQHEALKPLITLWLNLAGTALLDLTPNYQRRIWMTLDELPSLQQLPFLISQLAEVRKFGGCMVLGVQNIAHLRSIYGSHAAQSISDLCNTRIFLRSNDAEVAQWVSRQLGDIDEEEARESISYGANTMRDGVSLTRTRLTRPIVMPSDIQRLNEREGYLQLPGALPITTLQLAVLETHRDVLGFEEARPTVDNELDHLIANYQRLLPLLVKKDEHAEDTDNRAFEKPTEIPRPAVGQNSATKMGLMKKEDSTRSLQKQTKGRNECDLC